MIRAALLLALTLSAAAVMPDLGDEGRAPPLPVGFRLLAAADYCPAGRPAGMVALGSGTDTGVCLLASQSTYGPTAPFCFRHLDHYYCGYSASGSI